MKNWIRRAMLTLAVVLSLVGGSAVAANASLADCPAGQACIWSGANGTGTRWTITYSGSGGAFVCNILGTAWHQDASWSVQFGSGHGLAVFVGTNGCQTGILGSWGPNRMGNLSPTLDAPPSGTYKNVGAYYIF